MKNLFFISIILFLCACNSGGSGERLKGYANESIPGSSATVAVAGGLANGDYQKGIARDGAKNGMWVEYYPEGNIKTISNYVDGKLALAKLEFSDRGQITKQTEYLNDQLHGTFIEYKNGRILQERNYSEGQLHGEFKKYTDRGKLQQSGSFKDGKQHGSLKYYNEEEEVMMEYMYENGEKVSGGIKEK